MHPAHAGCYLALSPRRELGIAEPTARRIIQAACYSQPRVEAMVQDSALSRKAQKAFLLSIRPRFKLLHC